MNCHTPRTCVSDKHSGVYWALKRIGTSLMATLAQIYEEHAEECLRTAARMDDPKRRDLMLKLANQWREDAKALRRGEAPSGAAPAPARRNKR
jgi:hypothetical protein